MSRINRCRPALEALEERWVPTVNAKIVGGDILRITGRTANPGNTISILQTAQGSFTVSDGGVPVFVSGPGTVDNLLILLPTHNANVDVNLGGFLLNGSLTATMAYSGTNTLTVNNGAIAHNLTYTGGFGRDVLTVGPGVGVLQNLVANTLFGSDQVTLDTGSRVANRAVINTFFGNDRIDLNGTIGDGSGLNLIVDSGFGDDQVNLNAGFTLNGDGRVYLGFGNDRFTLSDAAVINGTLTVDGGFGNDVFVGTPRANVHTRGF